MLGAGPIAAALSLLMTTTTLSAYPGPYSGSRILGGGDVCAVFSECPDRLRDKELGITHYYFGDYVTDYLSAVYPSFGIDGEWEDARGTGSRARPTGRMEGVPRAPRTGAPGMAQERPTDALEIIPGAVETVTKFRSLLDPDLALSYSVFSCLDGIIVFEIMVHNEGDQEKRVVVRPAVRFRVEPDSIEPWESDHPAASALFKAVRLDLGFTGDDEISSVRVAPGPFPGIERSMIVSAHTVVRSCFFLSGAPLNSPPPRIEGLTIEKARLDWEEWIRTERVPALSDSILNRAFAATLIATAATSLRGAVPADMTGQFKTDGMPQLYPRDALMTARMLLEAGQTDMASEIVRFWSASIPQKSPGEWYARYDAFARATPGGSGAAYDEPEWDSNGYYTTLMLRLFGRTGAWHGDYALVRSLLDFVLFRQDADGLLTEGGIIEWTGLLPPTNMNVAAGLRHGAVLSEIRGDTGVARRYRAAAERMETGLERLFSRARGAYMDRRGALEQFCTASNFGYVWGFSDHLQLALTNAWYRENAFKLGYGVQYFEAEGYGDDCFGFTTGASARYHAEVGAPEIFREHLRWMLERSNVYGMMPERVHFPGGHDVSEASPLSWCNAEYAAALLAGARVADPGVGADPAFAGAMLQDDLQDLARILAALPADRAREELAARNRALAEKEWSSPESALRATRELIDELLDYTGGERTGDLRDDLRILVLPLAARADRIAWNLSGAEMAASLSTTTVAIHEPVELMIEARGEGVTWRSVDVERLDGNESLVSQSLALDSESLALPIRFEKGSPPYATAVRVTVHGAWKEIPFQFSRTLPIRIVPRFEVDVEERGEALQVRLSQNVPGPAAVVSVEAPDGWITVEGAPGVDGSRLFRFTPPSDLLPGRVSFRIRARTDREDLVSFTAAWRTTESLERPWRFRTGDDASWAAPELDDSSWEEIPVPSAWEKAGHPGYDGFAWYRTRVTVPASWRGSNVVLVLGAVDDEDWTYWNGSAIGHMVIWNSERRYVIPADAIRFGQENVIAVRVRDGSYDGGIWKTPVRLELEIEP